MHSAPKNTTAHRYEEMMVQQMRNENLTKNVKMHRPRNAPAMMVVMEVIFSWYDGAFDESKQANVLLW